MSIHQKTFPKQRYLVITESPSGPPAYLVKRRLSKKSHFKGHLKKHTEMHLGNSLKTADQLLSYLEASKDFPDYELAESIEKARSEFRIEFNLES